MGTRVDLTDMVFTRLKVLEYAGNGKWKCECQCDNKTIKYVKTYQLTSGDTKSCGCLHSEIVRQKRRNSEDLTGRKFGGLEVLSYSHSDKYGTHWLCRCGYCGSEKTICASWIKEYDSCGCRARESSKKNRQKLYDGMVEGTNVYKITRSEARKDSTTKVRGVSYVKRDNVYHASIGFQGERYRLGYYKDIEDAIKARKVAEEKLYGEFLKWYAEAYPEQWEKLQKKLNTNQ